MLAKKDLTKEQRTDLEAAKRILDEAMEENFSKWWGGGNYFFCCAFVIPDMLISWYDMLYRQFLKDLDVPVAYGFPAGHGEKNYPLLMGEKVRLTVTQNDFTLEWTDSR